MFYANNFKCHKQFIPTIVAVSLPLIQFSVAERLCTPWIGPQPVAGPTQTETDNNSHSHSHQLT